MLKLSTSEEKNNNGCFKLIGAESTPQTTHLITNEVSLISPSNNSGSVFDTCSFYNGPSDATIMAFGESCESCGSIASDVSSGMAIAFSGSGESCGSIASAGVSSCSVSSSCGGGCSYSC